MLIGALSSEHLFLISLSLSLFIAARSLTVPPVDSITVFLLKQLGALARSLGSIVSVRSVVFLFLLTHSLLTWNISQSMIQFLCRPPTGRRSDGANFCASRELARTFHSARVHIYMNFNCKTHTYGGAHF